MEILKKYCFLYFSICFGGFAGGAFGQTQKPETQMYAVLDSYVENPSPAKLQTLQIAEDTFVTSEENKTSQAYLAYVILMCNHAYYCKQYQRIPEAISLYEKAWQTYEQQQLSDYDIIEYCLKPLGNLYTQTGNLIQAENTIKHYYTLATSPKNTKDLVQVFAAVLNLSNVYQALGKYQAGITLLEQTQHEKWISEVQKALLDNNLGTNYLALYKIQKKNEYLNKAALVFEHAIRILKQSKTHRLEISNGLRNISLIYSLGGQYAKANATLLEAEHILEQDRLMNVYSFSQLQLDKTQLFLLQKKYVEASICLQKVYHALIPNLGKKEDFPNSYKQYNHPLLSQALDLQGQLYKEQGAFAKALQCYAQASDIDRSLEENMPHEISKVVHQVQTHQRCEKQIESCILWYRQTQNKQYLYNAFELCDSFKKNFITSFRQEKKLQTKTEALLNSKIMACQNAIIAEQLKQNQASLTKISKWIALQNQYTLQWKSIQKKKTITEKNIDFATLLDASKRDNITYLSYFWGDEKTIQFKITKGKITVHYLANSTDLKTQISRFLAFFTASESINKQLSQYNTQAYALYQVLQIDKTSSKIVINPDGLLQFLPFEALITRPTRSHNFSKIPYIVKTHQISYCKNPEDITKETSYTASKILGIFPEFNNTAFALPYSKKEQEAIIKQPSATILEGSKATYAHFLKQARSYSILHFCTHASAGDDMIPASIKFSDREVNFSELYQLNLKPDLVVLSACETGIGLSYNTQNPMSVSRGFEMAGSQNQLYSLWKVNDYTTSVLMNHFYTALTQHNYADANSVSKKAFLEDASVSNLKKSPYYWAPMVYYGTLVRPKTNFPFLYVAFGLLGLFGFVLGIKKIRSSTLKRI